MAEKRRNESEEFKREAVLLVTEHGYGVSETTRNWQLARLLASCLQVGYADGIAGELYSVPLTQV